jgi:hypothetical protein
MAINAEHIRDEIYRFIQDDPTIRDASHVSVSVVKHGLLGKRELEIRGRVETEIDRTKIEEIAQAHSHGIGVVDNLRVQESKGRLH